MTDQLFLALTAPGPGAAVAPGELRAFVLAAEQAGFTLVAFADSPDPGAGELAAIEAGTRAAFVSTTTDRIGLAPELHVTATEPFHLATQLASLDHASNGRGAWLVGASNDAADLATIGSTALPADAWHREVTDVIDVVRDLWDSWQDDAVIRDVAAGRYLDPSRVHHVNFTGARFDVKGPLITPRPPQGQLVVIAPEHLDVAGRADIVLVDGIDVAEITARGQRARAGGAPLVFAEIEVAGGSSASLIELLGTLAGVVDGVWLHPADPLADVPFLIETVLPALTAAGLHRPPAPGATLRSTLGLPRPANRFARPATTTA
jgi:alkanesulfonate monooxygenase SsuD/methylene tetrahydromethanopterin reductase-like flavin-dependent oxidoreductase (luciferase family)